MANQPTFMVRLLNDNYAMKLYFSCFLIVGLVLWQFSSSNPEVLVSYDAEEGLIVVEAGNTYMEYERGESFEASYRVVNVEKADGMTHRIGFAYSAGLLTEDDYQEFETLQREGTCPANFLNDRADKYLLAFDSPELERLVKDLNFKTGSRLSMQAADLNFAYGEMKGHELGSFTFGDTQPVLVESIDVLDRMMR